MLLRLAIVISLHGASFGVLFDMEEARKNADREIKREKHLA